MASFVTRYDLEGRAAPRAHNVALAAQHLDGAIIAPGETLSFNQTVGERSAERGYEAAPVIRNGRIHRGLDRGEIDLRTGGSRLHDPERPLGQGGGGCGGEDEERELLEEQLRRCLVVAFEPGTEFLYSNYALLVAEAAVEGSTGTSFADYVERAVFAPLGMERSTVGHRGRAAAASYSAARSLWTSTPSSSSQSSPSQSRSSRAWAAAAAFTRGPSRSSLR